jgi:hypothetical protein
MTRPTETMTWEEADEACAAGLLPPIPDFLAPGYPLDIPPHRMALATCLLKHAEAWRRCPQEACRRGRTCRGGDGPPCFRADREALHLVLVLNFLAAYDLLAEEDAARALAAHHSPYAVLGLRAAAPAERHPVAPASRAR